MVRDELFKENTVFRCAEAAMPQSPSNLEAVVGMGTGAGVVEVELVEEGVLSASLFLMASDVLSMMFANCGEHGTSAARHVCPANHG